MLTAKEIAEKYADRVITVNLISSSPAMNNNGDLIKTFSAKIIGWKQTSVKDPFEYVVVQVLAPNKTKLTLGGMANKDYKLTTIKYDSAGWGKKVFPGEINLPADDGKPIVYKSAKKISEWPHTCRDCGSPAFVLSFNIDCSNKACKNKYKTNSGLDLFFPRE